MKRRLFSDPSVRPTEGLLREQLGGAMDYYSTIVRLSDNYRKQWQYSKGNGWILKVDDMRKALYYLIAFEEGIEISLTVRDEERTAFLKNGECAPIYPQLQAGTRYPEGYALRIEIESATECESAVQFLLELMKVRPASRMLTDKQKSRPNPTESKSRR